MATAVVPHCERKVGHLTLECLEIQGLQGRVGSDLAIQIAHISGVMAIVMKRHGVCIDRRLQGFHWIGQWGKAELGPDRCCKSKDHQQGDEAMANHRHDSCGSRDLSSLTDPNWPCDP